MKRFVVLAAFLLAAFTSPAQVTFTVRPLVGTTVIDSSVVTSGSTLIRKTGTPAVFDTAKVKAGKRIQGPGIPFGATITQVNQSSRDSLYISSAATATTALATISVEFFTSSQAYTAGDALGWLFRMPKFKRIDNIIITDDASQLATGVTLVVFDSVITPTADNAAFSPTDADVDHLVGLGLLSVSNAWGVNKVWTLPATTLPIHTRSANSSSYYFGQLVAGGVGTYTAIDNLTLTIIGE